MQEIELKYALTVSEYRRLRAGLGRSKTSRFTNTFFDTPSFLLRKKHIGCRLRTAPGKAATLTVKHGGGTKGGLHRRTEIECEVSTLLARRIIAGKASLAELSDTEPIKALLKLTNPQAVASLSRLGSLTTARTKFKFLGLVGELDACRLGRASFHELEVESHRPKQADALTRGWLEKRGIAVRPEGRTKLGRFFESLNKRR